jgi:hypothetical protein
MNKSECFPLKHLRTICLGIFATGVGTFVGDPSAFLTRSGANRGSAALAQTQALQQPLSANDVSWLFPPPTQAGDFAQLISMGDLTVPNSQDPTKRDRVWSEQAFAQFLGIASSPFAQVAGTESRIGLPAEAQSVAAWHIAGVRIDPGAPGLSNDIIGQFGQTPQIRLIIQPVIRNTDGTPIVLDTAAHLIFSFTASAGVSPQPGCLQAPTPDLAALRAIVFEIADLRTRLGLGQLGPNRVTTSDAPLGVHPGLTDPTTRTTVSTAMKAFLERHLSDERLSAMAIMGLPAGKGSPWIFLSMTKLPPGVLPTLPNGGFAPVKGPALDGQQFAEMLNPAGASPRVVPEPHTNNRNPITCTNAALLMPGPPLGERHGSSTADLFANQ